MSEESEEQPTVRLSVNLSSDVAGVFKALADRKGISITEAVRRAIGVWRFVEDEVEEGNELVVVEKDGTQRKVALL